MVSLKHEGVLELVRDRPAFAADLLGELLGVQVPRGQADPTNNRRKSR